MNYIDALMAYETNDLNPRQDIEFISYVIKQGHITTLHGHYCREARDMMNANLIDEEGNLTTTFHTNVTYSSCEPLVIDN